MRRQRLGLHTGCLSELARVLWYLSTEHLDTKEVPLGWGLGEDQGFKMFRHKISGLSFISCSEWFVCSQFRREKPQKKAQTLSGLTGKEVSKQGGSKIKCEFPKYQCDILSVDDTSQWHDVGRGYIRVGHMARGESLGVDSSSRSSFHLFHRRP